MAKASEHSYLIALGSNMRVPGVGAPRSVLDQAMAELAHANLDIIRRSRIIESEPIGPSQRRYANAVLLVASDKDPPALLAMLQAVETQFGRRRRGQAWRSRPLDLDIVLWSGGIWVSPALTLPHPEFRRRNFVLEPAASIAPHWRDPVTGLSMRQLAARLPRDMGG